MKGFLKTAFGIGLLVFVFSTGMIDLQTMKDSFKSPIDILVIQLTMLAVVFFQSLRWFVMNRSQGGTLTCRRTFEISLVVHFIALLSPSSVGMDVVRGWYSIGENDIKKSKSIWAIVSERVVGLFVLFFFSAVGGFFLFQGGVKQLQGLVIFSALCTAAGFMVVPIFVRLGYFSYRSYVLCWIVSVLTTLAAIAPFVYIGHRMGVEMSLLQYAVLIPWGMIASSLPLAPMGIGVGQVAFYQLAQWLGTAPEKSTALITIVQAHNILFGLLCGIVYFRAGSRLKAAKPVHS